MRRLICLLMALLSLSAALAEDAAPATDGFYDLAPLVQAQPWETAVLVLQRSYYSGDPVYKGSTRAELIGSCAIHSAAVALSNSLGQAVSAQAVAKANNSNVKQAADWSNYVAWGRTGKPWNLDFSGLNLAEERKRLKRQGLDTVAQRQALMDLAVEQLQLNAADTGLILHFNNSGEMNGGGTRHVVVLVGCILEDDTVVDLLLSDSSVPAPEGACVRLSQSSLPMAMLGEKAYERLADDGEDMALMMMDYLVSCRWVIPAKWPTVTQSPW